MRETERPGSMDRKQGNRMSTSNPIESQQICASCEHAIRHGIGNLKYVPGLIKRIISEELWRSRRVENGDIVQLNSFRELITGKPLAGWGESPEKVEAIIRDDADALAMWREAMKGEAGRPEKSRNNVTELEPAKTGNSRAYTLSRLAKESPELYDRVKAGELSANAAAIQAGWRKKPSPLDLLRSAWRKASRSERETFLGEVA